MHFEIKSIKYVYKKNEEEKNAGRSSPPNKMHFVFVFHDKRAEVRRKSVITANFIVWNENERQKTSEMKRKTKTHSK